MADRPDAGKTDDHEPPSVEQYLVKDPERFALNLARVVEQAGKAASAWAEPRERGEVRDSIAEPMADMVKTFSKLTEYWLADPKRALEAQTRLFAGYMNVWASAIHRIGGVEDEATGVKPERGDKRFQDLNGARTLSSIFSSRPIWSPRAGRLTWSSMPKGWTSIRVTKPVSM